MLAIYFSLETGWCGIYVLLIFAFI